MSRVTWLLENGSPVIEIFLHDGMGFTHARKLLADTGAGPQHSPFHLVLSERDCGHFGRRQSKTVGVGGFVRGTFPLFHVWIEIPVLSFVKLATAVAVPSVALPDGLSGVASFRLLNGFTYGNFGSSTEFGLETT